MGGYRSEAFYLPLASGRRFCMLHHPDAEEVIHGSFVHVHALADEMNRSRRTVALAARALAANGWAVVLIDLSGCGDSPGEFGDATWESWIDDAVCAHSWAKARFGGAAWLWGSRAGCLIAAQAGARIGGRVSLLLWQPVLAGRAHLTQFLRVKLAEEALGQAAERGGTKELRASLERGEPVEVAGYTLNPSLVAGLDKAEVGGEETLARVVWCEVGTGDAPKLLPASEARVATLRARGVQVDTHVVKGPQFWQTVEVAECPELVDATVRAVGG